MALHFNVPGYNLRKVTPWVVYAELNLARQGIDAPIGGFEATLEAKSVTRTTKGIATGRNAK